MTDAPTETPSETPEAAQPPEAPAKPAKKAAAKKTAAKKTAAKKTAAKKTAAKKAAAAPEGDEPAKKTAAKKTAAKKTAAKKTTAKKTAAKKTTAKKAAASEQLTLEETPAEESTSSAAVLFQAPAATPAEAVEPAAPVEEEAVEEETPAADETPAEEPAKPAEDAEQSDDDEDDEEESDGTTGPARRRRRRGGRRRRKPAGAGQGNDESGEDAAEQPAEGESTETAAPEAEDTDGEQNESGGQGGGSSSSRRRRRRRRAGEGPDDGGDDPENTVTRVRKPRSSEDEITSISGSTRLEAKKQRRREGREAGRRRAPIVSEAEFLARRESVERVMVVRQRKDLTQIAVLEDKVLVEHYVARESQTSLIGNVYLGRVQNVLPSMEAAFIDIGKGRNAVLYAGEVNWSALGHKDGQPRKIESVLQSGQTVLVQVSKDPIGHKGARLTSQVSLAGRFLVYVPDGTTSGISRKLPDTERARLKALLKEAVPASAGVIVRTAAEGASEDELTRDIERLKTKWEAIEAKVAKGNAPQLLHGEPDLTLKVVRDLFTEDFAKLVVQGDEAWASVKEYVDQIAPDLADRLEHHEPSDGDLFATYRIDEQIAKGLDRKVWLPSGGSLVIDRTEAMTVVDVNTGKFTGSGGNLEETVTKNNLEAAEEIVRQLRLRDIGGIIVVDFIDMVLEANRDLVLRRLVECLGRDRTRHQVAEVTSLGLVQMTRKRIGTGLVEAFSENCSHCQGRGIVVHDLPVEPKRGGNGGGNGGEQNGDEPRRGNRRRKGRGQGGEQAEAAPKPVPSPKDVAAMAKHHDEEPAEEPTVEEPKVEEPKAEEPKVEEPKAEEPKVEEPKVEEPKAEEPKAEEPEEPVAKTTVVTRTRKRASTGPLTPAAAPAPAPVPEPAPAAEQPAEEPAPEPVVTAPVVKQTRRRSSSRAATPTVEEAPAEEAAETPTTAVDADGETEPHVEHVPVKKKGGARKR
ncbi:Rne/Rng family ribonuclease [Nocardioides sp. LML1-1-1.1]|uniref:Rne/Rng family ribonuclease n=1 Tax=Nocardioides sp. LML1-1-1.1 TaxID=3135248 RepID=UPI003428EAF8